MNPKAAPHQAVLSSLAEEIRHFSEWLAGQAQPSRREVASRIRTLREAASAAGLNAVQKELEGLDGEEGFLRMDEALQRLSQLITTMANAAQQREVEWTENVRHAEEMLDQVSRELTDSIQSLSDKALLLDLCVSAPPGPTQGQLMSRLGEELRAQVANTSRLRRLVQDTWSCLHDASQKLIRSLPDPRSVPLSPALLGLRDLARTLGRDTGKPLALIPDCSGIEVAIHQHDAVVRILEFVVRSWHRDGLETPEERRKAGKATVGSLHIHGVRGASVLTLILEDDGRSDNRELHLSASTRNDLRQLRARLLREQDDEHGQRLRLQLPVWHTTLEAVPIQTTAGPLFVPLHTIGSVFSAPESVDPGIPVISLERRAGACAAGEATSGLVFEIEGWRGLLHAHILGAHTRVIPAPPAPEDPGWAMARVNDAGRSVCLLHPLYWMDLSPTQVCLFPANR